MSLIFCAVVFVGASAIADRAQAQWTASLSPAIEQSLSPWTSRARISKTELATRFQEIKDQYAALRTATAKYAPLNADAPFGLRVTRMQISSTMRAYDHYESHAQKQRDELNRLVDLTENESLRLQIALDRLAKMKTMISGLMQKVNETGDALARNTGSTTDH